MKVTKKDLGFLIPWGIAMSISVVLLVFTIYKLCTVGR